MMEELKKNYRLYILFEDHTPVDMDIVSAIEDTICEKGNLKDFGFGSAYNMPIYLLGEIEEYPDEAVVVAVDWDDDGRFHPRFLVEEEEINLLIDVLDKNQDGDSWEIVVEVNRAIRGN